MGKYIREFLRDLFGSRMVEHLQVELLQLREDYESRLRDKETLISSLREEKAAMNAKITIYEMTIMPRSSSMGAEIVSYTKPSKPNFAADFSMPATMTRWEKVQADHEASLAAEAAEEAKTKTAAKG